MTEYVQNVLVGGTNDINNMKTLENVQEKNENCCFYVQTNQSY